MLDCLLPMSSPHTKWWQKGVIDVPVQGQKEPIKPVDDGLDRVNQFAIDFAERLTGPVIGTTYKVEVQGPLSVDGSFWVCPLATGFIRNKLEPLSRQIQSIVNLMEKFDGTPNEMVFAKSANNDLWMRGIVMKVLNGSKIRLRFVDVGSIEDVQKSLIWKLPDSLQDIPFMAYCCTLFDEPVNISYNEKYRFNDLVNKQVLNFTCESIKVVNNTSVLYGQMETFVEEPFINVNNEIRKSKELSEEDSRLDKAKGSNIKVTINNNIDNKTGRVVKSVPDRLKELLEHIRDATLGETYKIEITSPLKTDGSFWACPVSKNFFKDNLEPLSDMLKTSILADPGLRNLEGYNGILCVKSKETQLLGRGLLVSEVDQMTYKIQMVDMGRTENHLKSKVFRVPKELAEIPYMAFHCSLFEQKLNLSYQERWKFADLCKKKVLDFTILKFFEREKKNLTLGKLVYKEGESIIDVIEEIKKAILSDDL